MKRIEFEKLPFNELQFIKGRAEHGRQVFMSKDKRLLYKLWYPDWQWANMVSEAYNGGCYDEAWPTGVEGMVEDKDGRHRGYVMKYVPPSRHLSSFAYSRFSRRGLKTFWLRRHRLNPDFLQQFLHEIFGRAHQSGYIFTELSVPNLWIGDSGYHIFDLDSVRPVDWLFESDPTTPDYIRSFINKQAMFDGLDELYKLHNMQIPPRPQSARDLTGI